MQTQIVDQNSGAESASWDALARYYHSDTGRLTSQMAEPLLDAAAVGPASMLLDLATGPGYGAGAAQARGAIATGIDFAPEMLREASRNFADALFYEGDAQSLVFARNFFDVVISVFGLPYIESPGRAIGEVFRVLKPEGRIAYTTWATPTEAEFLHQILALITEVVAEQGEGKETNDSAPENTGYLALGQAADNEQLLKERGFESITVSEVQLQWEPQNPREIVDVYLGGLISPRSLESLQHATREHINDAVLELASGVSTPLHCTALLVCARKPA